MAVQETVDITINSSQAIASLRNIENSLNILTNGFKDFMAGVVDGMTSALRETNRAAAGVDKMRKSFDDLGAAAGKTKVGKKIGDDAKEAERSLTSADKSAIGFGKRLLGLEAIVGAFTLNQLISGAMTYAEKTKNTELASYQAARAQQALTENANNFNRALLRVLQPLTEFIANTNISTETFQRLIHVIVTGGAVFGFMVQNVDALIKIFKKLYNIVNDAVTITENGFLNIATIFANVIKRSDELKYFIEMLGKAKKALKEFFDLQTQPMGPARGSSYDPQKLEEIEANLAAARVNLNNQIQDSLLNYRRQNDAIAQGLRLENKLFNSSSDALEIERLRLRFQQERTTALDEYARRIRDLSPAETAAGGMKMIQAQQEAYMKLSKAAEATQIAEVKGLQRKRAELDAFNKQMEYTTEMYNQQVQRSQALASILQGVRGETAGVLFEREQMGRGPVQQQIASAYESARRSALEAQRQFAETFGDADGLTPERMAELVAGLDAIAAAFNNLAYQTENNILISQQWSTGWKDAYAAFVDNALNAADRAREVFNGMVSSMENALDNFVRTGKLNFRDLINSMIADLMSAALRQAFRNLLMATSGGGGGGWLSSLGRFFAGFFANGGFIPPGKAGIVGERGPELVQGPAQVTPLTGMGAPINNYYTYNINALDAKSVAQLFSENRRTLLGVTEQARKEMPIRQRF